MEKDQHQSLLEAISTPEPILVVDDDTDVLQMIQWVLEDEGFEVQTATDGQEALILARQRQPALVILDMDYLSLMAVTWQQSCTLSTERRCQLSSLLLMDAPRTRLVRLELLRFCASPSRLQISCRRYSVSWLNGEQQTRAVSNKVVQTCKVRKRRAVEVF